MRRPFTVNCSWRRELHRFSQPPEGLRMLGDSVAFATKAEGYLRQLLTKAGVEVPIKVDLEIMKYVDQRVRKN